METSLLDLYLKKIIPLLAFLVVFWEGRKVEGCVQSVDFIRTHLSHF